jgi:hypothetical protein
MALTQVTGPYPIFTDLDGSPLDDGYLYIGAINDDPEQNPIQVFFDANLTIPATQPIRTNNGYAYRNGTPALLYTGGEFSITIRNKRNEFVLYSPIGYGFDPAAVSASVVKNDFIGDGVTVAFVLSASPSTILATNIFINGVYQEKDSYTLSGNTITFTVAPPLSSSIEILTNETGVINSGNANDISYTLTAAGATLQSVQTKLEQYISVKDFGAVGDDVADDTAEIQAALDYAATVDGCTVYFPDGIYLISDPLIVYSNTTITMSGTVKVDSMPLGGYETVFVTDPVSPADNIQFINPQIDANNVSPASGIMIRYGATNVRVSGGYIRDCVNDSVNLGGRAFNIEGGTGTQNVTINGTNITGCWNGVSVAGGAAQANSNVSITNLTISDCQVAISLFGNTSGYPHTGEFMQAVFSNIAIRNCGHLTTFTTQAGVIVSDRGSNVSFSDIYVFNDSTYGAVGSLWRGDANNISMNNVTMDGDLTAALFDFSSYAESNAYPLAANSSLNSRFMNVKHNGTIPDIIALPIIGASYLTNCQFDVITDDVTSGAPGTANTANKTTCRLKAYNKTENAFIEGFLSDIGSITFAEATDTLYPADNFAARAWGLFDGTTGTMARSFNTTSVRNSAGNYTVSFDNTAPVVSYVVVASAATATGSDQVLSIQNKTQNDFDIFTYSGGVATDMPSINFVVYY